MNRSVQQALMICLAIIVLVTFVAYESYRQAREEIAAQFSAQQLLLAQQTAQLVEGVLRRVQAEVAGLAARFKVFPDGPRGQITSALRQTQEKLGGLAYLLFCLDARGRRWVYPMEASWPADAYQFVWAKAQREHEVRIYPVPHPSARPSLDLVVVAPLWGEASGRFQGLLGAVLDWEALARRFGRPWMLSDFPNETYLLTEGQEIIAATDKSAVGHNFARLFVLAPEGHPPLSLRGAGYEEATNVRLGRRETHLLAFASLRLAGKRWHIVTTVPRRMLLERLVPVFIRLAALTAFVVVVVLLFALMAGRAVAAQKQEARRRIESGALYQISRAMLEISSLETLLDHITTQAKDLLEAEGCTIALVDDLAQELVFRFVKGESPEAEAQLQDLHLPLDVGVVGWVVRNREAVLVSDAASDPRFSEQADRLTGLTTVSLICAPLIVGDRAIGAIELVNKKRHPFSQSDLNLLSTLAGTVALAIEKAQLQEELKEQERLKRELEIAHSVQAQLLPKAMPRVPGYDFFGTSEPAHETGGDFYDLIPVGENQWGLVIADVADKGLGAALFMAICKSLLWATAREIISPQAALERLNDLILEVSESDLFVTVFYGVLDVAQGRLVYCVAGHNPPVFYQAAERKFTELRTPGMALGVRPGLTLQEASLSLAAGDLLLLYTDGVTEALNPQRELFGKERLRQVLAAQVNGSAQRTVKAILQAVREFAQGETQFDDITLLVVRKVGE